MLFSNTIRIAEIELIQEGPVRIQPVAKFEDAGLHPVMLKNVKLCNYEVPTPIQKYCLPAIMLGYDVIGIAQTGKKDTSPTCAFISLTTCRIRQDSCVPDPYSQPAYG